MNELLEQSRLPPQPSDGTNVTLASSDPSIKAHRDLYSTHMVRGCSAVVDHLDPEQNNIVPHARTLRHVCSQVKHMVIDGISDQRIKSYLRLG